MIIKRHQPVLITAPIMTEGSSDPSQLNSLLFKFSVNAFTAW